MTGRFAQAMELADLLAAFNLPATDISYKRRWNVAPQSEAVIVHCTDDAAALTSARWGSEIDVISPRKRKINVTLKQAAGVRHYGNPLRRCIVPASGWYEWQRGAKPNYPTYFSISDLPVIALAALWNGLTEDPRFVIVTKRASTELRRFACLMPFVLPNEREQEAWLHGTADAFRTMPRDAKLEILATAVSGFVNDPSRDSSACIVPRVRLMLPPSLLARADEVIE